MTDGIGKITTLVQLALAATLIPNLLVADQNVEVAFASPPELGADLLLEIAKAPGRSRKERVEILVRAFEMAGAAKYALRRTGASSAASGTDSDAGVVISALGPGLDRLSLQARVIEALVLLEPVRARELLETLRLTAIPPLGCEDALGYSFEAFDKAVVAVIQRGYSAKEVREGEPALLAEGLLRQVSSPFQFPGAFQILRREDWKEGELRSLVSAFAIRLTQLSVDDRSFHAATHFSVLQDLMALEAKLRMHNIDPFSLIQAFRGYVVRHLKAARCADTKESPAMSRFVELFNQDLVSKQANLDPISAEDQKPEKVLEVKARVYDFWSTPESSRLLDGLRTLRFGTREQIAAREKLGIVRPDRLAPYLSDAERSTVAWRASLDAFLKEFHEWESRSNEPLLARFFESCAVLRGLIAIVPDTERKLALMGDLLATIAASELRQIDPPVWRLQLEMALTMSEISETDRNSFVELARRSGDVYVSAKASQLPKR
jgi:hypothetical protein